jgi:hypothetical protein
LRKQRQLWAILVAAMAIAVVVAGCGGGGGDTTGGSTAAETGGEEASSGGPAPSKAAFVKEADMICTQGEADLEGEFEKYAEEEGLESEPTEEEAIEIAVKVALPNLSRQAEEIGALTPPEGDEETVESMVSTLEDGIAEVEDDPEKEAGFEKFTEEANAYGLKGCAGEGV